eukprot:360831-Chlamydomonas_euryale.AAC.6
MASATAVGGWAGKRGGSVFLQREQAGGMGMWEDGWELGGTGRLRTAVQSNVVEERGGNTVSRTPPHTCKNRKNSSSKASKGPEHSRNQSIQEPKPYKAGMWACLENLTTTEARIEKPLHPEQCERKSTIAWSLWDAAFQASKEWRASTLYPMS